MRNLLALVSVSIIERLSVGKDREYEDHRGL